MKPVLTAFSALVLAAATASVHAASAETYPTRSVRVLVGLAPGGGTDTIARVLTQKLAEVFNQSFVVDNRPGAGGMIAGEMAARATPDGYTLIVVTPTHVVNPSLYKSVRYDAIKDFAPVARLVDSQYYLSVSNSVPASNLKEFLALAKSSPKPLSYASTGIGSANHLSGEIFKTMAGINLVHVPYKGGAPALNALMAGEVQASFTSSAALPHAKAGRIKTLAATGAKRPSAAPNIPTIAEAGVPGYEVIGWYGLAAPAGTPKPVIQRLNTTINRVLPELRPRFQALSVDIAGGSAEEFGAFLVSEREKWGRAVKISGARVD